MKRAVKSLQSEQAAVIAKNFARERHLALDDPIVRDLRNGMARALGLARWRNNKQADRDAAQPSLFSKTNPTPEGGAK
jgi:hypothetical protein